MVHDWRWPKSKMFKSGSLTNSDTLKKVATNDSIWNNNKVSMTIDASLVISVHGSITDGMF